jgi:hypothetical protein
MKTENHVKKKGLQKIKSPFLNLMNWIQKAQKGEAVCKS